MSTVTVGDVTQSQDKYLTRTKTANASTTGDVYVFPALQNYIKITNGGAYDLHFNVGEYVNQVLHPTDVIELFTDFTQFDIIARGGACAFTFVSRELDTANVDDARLFALLKAREDLGSDLNIAASDATSSAATIASAIAGEAKKFTRTVSLEIQNTGGTKNTKFNGSIPISVSKESTAGIIAIQGGAEYVTFISGAATVKLDYTGTWAKNDTATLTIGPGERYGYVLAAETSVDTITD